MILARKNLWPNPYYPFLAPWKKFHRLLWYIEGCLERKMYIDEQFNASPQFPPFVMSKRLSERGKSNEIDFVLYREKMRESFEQAARQGFRENRHPKWCGGRGKIQMCQQGIRGLVRMANFQHWIFYLIFSEISLWDIPQPESPFSPHKKGPII